MNVAQVTADLIAEQDALDDVVAPLPDGAWLTPTPSPGWSVADQIGHLTFFDRTAALAPPCATTGLRTIAITDARGRSK